MGKIPFIGILLFFTLFSFLWYNEYIQSVCIHTLICSELEPQIKTIEGKGKNETNRFKYIVNNNKSTYSESTPNNTNADLENMNVSTTAIIKKNIIQNVTDTVVNYLNVARSTNNNETGSRQGNLLHNSEDAILNITKETLLNKTANADNDSVVLPKNYISQDIELEPTSGDKHILFIETRCILTKTQGGDPGLSLKKRQACVVESAARMNPDYKVYILYSCPLNGKLNDSMDHVQSLFLYPNVKLWKLNISQHFRNTPLEEWDFKAAINSSQWPDEHSSDVLRYITLWKYGGIYLDLDVVILKSLNELGTNYVGVESEDAIASCVLSFATHGIGHEVAENCVHEILHNFRGDYWAHNGPALISRVLLKMCNVESVPELTTEKCNGFKILSSKDFFPIPYQSWRLYFDESTSENTMELIENSYGVHVWNKLSKEANVVVGSKQPYNLIAEKSCPEVHSTSGNMF